MSTLQDLWTNYWWVLPAGFMLLCAIGCILGGRRIRWGCWSCRPGYRPRRWRCC